MTFRRSCSATVFVLAFLLSIYLESFRILFHLIMFVSGGVAAYEFFSMARHKNYKPDLFVGILATLVIIYNGATRNSSDLFVIIPVIIMFSFVMQITRYSFDNALANVCINVFGPIYIGIPIAMLYWFLSYSNGPEILVFLFFVTWQTDVGGYFGGKFLASTR